MEISPWAILAGPVVTWAIERTKQTLAMRALKERLPGLHRYLSVAVSALAGLGLVWNVTGNSQAGWHLGLYIPPLSDLTTAIGNAIATHTAATVYYHHVVIPRGGGR